MYLVARFESTGIRIDKNATGLSQTSGLSSIYLLTQGIIIMICDPGKSTLPTSSSSVYLHLDC